MVCLVVYITLRLVGLGAFPRGGTRPGYASRSPLILGMPHTTSG